MKFLSALYNLEICKRISELKVQLKNIIAVYEILCSKRCGGVNRHFSAFVYSHDV